MPGNAAFHSLKERSTMRDNKGFTLIELLIVVVIIGILAAIAIPKFSSTREKAYISAMKSDLRNLSNQQELYYADNYTYSTSLTDVELFESDRVTVSVGVGATTGWSATASHTSTSVTCAIYYGDASAVSPATEKGVVACGAGGGT
jgi:prepilin-type N-terminal cleavage/methylation domain-containing protein